MNNILGLIRSMGTAIHEGPEKLGLKDISEHADIIENQLTDTIGYVKTAE